MICKLVPECGERGYSFRILSHYTTQFALKIQIVRKNLPLTTANSISGPLVPILCTHKPCQQSECTFCFAHCNLPECAWISPMQISAHYEASQSAFCQAGRILLRRRSQTPSRSFSDEVEVRRGKSNRYLGSLKLLLARRSFLAFCKLILP